MDTKLLRELGVTKKQFEKKMFDGEIRRHVESFNENALENGSNHRACWSDTRRRILVIEGRRVIKSLRPFVNPDTSKDTPYILFETMHEAPTRG